MRINHFLLLFLFFSLSISVSAQKKKKSKVEPGITYDEKLYNGMSWRNIGPFRGGRSVTSSGVVGDPMTYYFG
ncbi:MAG: hypothetical protein AAGA66_19885, partial [Bacteroidota bacterium]